MYIHIHIYAYVYARTHTRTRTHKHFENDFPSTSHLTVVPPSSTCGSPRKLRTVGIRTLKAHGSRTQKTTCVAGIQQNVN